MVQENVMGESGQPNSQKLQGDQSSSHAMQLFNGAHTKQGRVSTPQHILQPRTAGSSRQVSLQWSDGRHQS